MQHTLLRAIGLPSWRPDQKGGARKVPLRPGLPTPPRRLPATLHHHRIAQSLQKPSAWRERGQSLDVASSSRPHGFAEKEVAAWLQACLPLPLALCGALAKHVVPLSCSKGSLLTVEGEPLQQLLIVRAGQLWQATSNNGSRQALGPGSVLHLAELVLRQPTAPETVEACGDAVIYCVPAAAFFSLVDVYEQDFTRCVTRLATAQLAQEQAQAKVLQRRMRYLQPYLLPGPTTGVLGVSKYAQRLRSQVASAARDPARAPVLIIGEPGLHKDNLAALIHHQSGEAASAPVVRLNCGRLDPAGLRLFGRGSKPGVLAVLSALACSGTHGATLILNDVHKLHPQLLPKLLALIEEGTWRAAPPAASFPPEGCAGSFEFDWDTFDAEGDFFSPGAAPAPQCLEPGAVRIVLITEHPVPALDAVKGLTTIKVPPLRVRPSDISAMVQYYLSSSLRCTKPGSEPVRMIMGPHSLRRMQAYPWPGNEDELAATVERAAVQHLVNKPVSFSMPKQPQARTSATFATPPPAGGLRGPRLVELADELLWLGKGQAENNRVDLFKLLPGFRDLVRSSFPEAINRVTAVAFPLMVAALLLGPQDREHNAFLNLFWCWWWPGIFLVYPILGRAWCAVCPFMVMGEIAQELKLRMGGTLEAWPKAALMEAYSPWALLAGFAAILVWEECWDLPHSAALSGSLLMLITAGAVLCSSFFERRLWCRYLCPIGGMNGLFSKAAITELRARPGVCNSAESLLLRDSEKMHCYKGGETVGEGMATKGCPLYSHPAQLADNRHCTLCMSCVRACPGHSPEFRLRLPGADLWENTGQHNASWGELSLLGLLAGAVFLHSLGGAGGDFELALQLGQSPELFTGVSVTHIAASLAVLGVPALLALGADVLNRRVVVPALGVAQPEPLLRLAYGYLPLVGAMTLAHYLPDLLTEGGQVLRVAAAGLGLDPAVAPAASAPPAVVSFLQGCTLAAGAGASVALSRRIAAAPFASFLPQVALIAGLVAETWTLDI